MIGSLDQSCRQFQFGAQFLFQRGHFTLIRLMIVACQMEQTMEQKDLTFSFQRVPQRLRVASGDFPGNRNIAGQLKFPILGRWK